MNDTLTALMCLFFTSVAIVSLVIAAALPAGWGVLIATFIGAMSAQTAYFLAE